MGLDRIEGKVASWNCKHPFILNFVFNVKHGCPMPRRRIFALLKKMLGQPGQSWNYRRTDQGFELILSSKETAMMLKLL